ncbi:hypothetical protein F4818DRAFT_82588 [Hypoxylon cercidicola]|nr:hypothetical protein F4818DRAFT_82588 [Hypoxylon cercidicola]
MYVSWKLILVGTVGVVLNSRGVSYGEKQQTEGSPYKSSGARRYRILTHLITYLGTCVRYTYLERWIDNSQGVTDESDGCGIIVYCSS